MSEKTLYLKKIRGIADYQFKPDTGVKIFPDDVQFTFSKSTGRIRHILLNGVILATIRPKDGLLALSLEGAKLLHKNSKKPDFRVVVTDDAIPYIKKGRSVFAKHVITADEQIRPHAEVLIVDKNDSLIGIGKAILNGTEMMHFKRGVAVKTRKVE
ncbi:MAG: PUA domain-containing protein [Candidatus Odinarchaeia archaeon]